MNGTNFPRRIACAAALMALSMSVHAATDAPTPVHCRVPDSTAIADGPLPRFAKRLNAAPPVTIVVLGSGSAAGNGTSGRDAAFPNRLTARLEAAYPKARFRTVVLAAIGQTAPAMHARFEREVYPLGPALVVWQTGSADATAGVPVTDFEGSIERGIAELHDRGSDVLLVDAQFGPRASLLVNTDAYRDAVHWNARRFEVPLFRRYDTMQSWWNEGVFDLDSADKSTQLANADRIHDCVAALIVRTIVRGVGDIRR